MKKQKQKQKKKVKAMKKQKKKKLIIKKTSIKKITPLISKIISTPIIKETPESAEKTIKIEIKEELKEKTQEKPQPAEKEERKIYGELDRYSLDIDNNPMEVKVYRKEGQAVPTYELSILDVSKPTKIIMDKIREMIISEVSFDLLGKEKKEGEKLIRQQFEKKIMKLMKEYFPDVNPETLKKVTNHIVLTSLGLGEIEFLLKDPNLEEIVVNSAKEPVWVYHKKHAWVKTNIILKDENLIRHYSTMIGRNVNKDITILQPLLDAHLMTGDRVNATLYPITTFGNTITIRKFATVPWTITDFIKVKTLSAEVAALIWLALQYEMSVLVIGGTGSGKTSALNVLSNFFQPNQRIITIEDTRELQLPKTLHWVAMETRLANPEGRGEVSMLDCVVNTLRMRPDRIVVGEIRRQREAEVLFEAMHTGHSVYGTFHANNAEEAIVRLTNPPINLPKVILSSLGLFLVQNRNRRTGRRRTFQVAELLPNGDPNILMQLNVAKDEIEKINPSKTFFKNLTMLSGLTQEQIDKDLEEKKKILDWLVKKDIRDIHEIGLIMTDYYVDKENLLKKVEGG